MTGLNPNIALECNNLTIGYVHKKKPQIIQQNIRLQIQKGQFVAILGQNGIGKSTLLRTMTKMQEPLAGSVFIEGRNLRSWNFTTLSNKISVVLTERLPESQLSVYELVALGRQPYTNWVGNLSEKDHQRIRASLEQTETFEFAQKYFYELSDGQLQRVMIARALAQDTDIIFLDEPTAHLDMHHTIKVFQVLKRLVKEHNKTIVLSTHEVNLAMKIADHFILLSEKQITSGTLDTLVSRKVFDQLFPSEILNFDPILEQFVVTKNNLSS